MKKIVPLYAVRITNHDAKKEGISAGRIGGLD